MHFRARTWCARIAASGCAVQACARCALRFAYATRVAFCGCCIFFCARAGAAGICTFARTMLYARLPLRSRISRVSRGGTAGCAPGHGITLLFVLAGAAAKARSLSAAWLACLMRCWRLTCTAAKRQRVRTPKHAGQALARLLPELPHALLRLARYRAYARRGHFCSVTVLPGSASILSAACMHERAARAATRIFARAVLPTRQQRVWHGVKLFGSRLSKEQHRRSYRRGARLNRSCAFTHQSPLSCGYVLLRVRPLFALLLRIFTLRVLLVHAFPIWRWRQSWRAARVAPTRSALTACMLRALALPWFFPLNLFVRVVRRANPHYNCGAAAFAFMAIFAP